ncbi:MAG: DUF2345 domain-containing protein, partial [Gammaproteobacteria bacterium]|nr:DUF2345 domain-containing protein [Gammaproteobacteria bacterium]MBU2216103.1 DUF2345 domain-containing protein [Gammaproteobacteria bacterium]MBU2322707.1 DUF2345 domain-containing protein [Gammaproteobacteria bacterium]
SGQKIVLDAGSELTLKAAGSFIKLDAGGITMVGPVIKFNSGGAPGKGSGAAPVLPGKVKAADADKAGMVTSAYSAQALAGHLLPATGCVFDASGKCMIHPHG